MSTVSLSEDFKEEEVAELDLCASLMAACDVLEVAQNNNQVNYFDRLKRHSQSQTKPRIQNNAIVKEGVAWYPNEFVIVHSDLTSTVWSEISENPAICSEQDRSHSAHRRQELDSTEETVQKQQKKESKCDIIGNSPSSFSSKLPVFEKSKTSQDTTIILDTSKMGTTQRNPARMLQRFSVDSTPSPVHTVTPQIRRESRVRECMRKYFPGCDAKEVTEKLMEENKAESDRSRRRTPSPRTVRKPCSIWTSVNRTDRIYRAAVESENRQRNKPISRINGRCGQVKRHPRFTIAPTSTVRAPTKSVETTPDTREQGDSQPEEDGELTTDELTKLDRSGSEQVTIVTAQKPQQDLIESIQTDIIGKKPPVTVRYRSKSPPVHYLENTKLSVPRVCSSSSSSSKPRLRKHIHAIQNRWFGGFNTVADKLARVAKLTEELTRIQSQLKQLQNYSTLGRYYCIADLYLGLLCAQLAPHVVNAMLSCGKSETFPLRRRKSRRSRLGSLKFLTLAPSAVKALLFERRRKRSRKLTNGMHNSLPTGISWSGSYSDQFNGQKVLNETTSEVDRRRLPWLRCRESCPLVLLPRWEQRFVGLREADVPPGGAVLVWRDRLRLTPAQMKWLADMVRRTFASFFEQ
ncbi:unnamed protein product [Echinostoma caproni]|uniref:C2H2-type domain-containing protein n=1 Tax=Echinostoma caproni TaxID=27848 RepID=A0A183A815_9TREM|nr:unnamed protein product [Echinostoma caproni]